MWISNQIGEASGAGAISQACAVRVDAIDDGERSPTLRDEDSGVLPTSQNTLLPSRYLEEGKVVDPTGSQHLALIEVGAGVIGMGIIGIDEVRVVTVRSVVKRVAPGVGETQAETPLGTTSRDLQSVVIGVCGRFDIGDRAITGVVGSEWIRIAAASR